MKIIKNKNNDEKGNLEIFFNFSFTFVNFF